MQQWNNNEKQHLKNEFEQEKYILHASKYIK